MLKLSFSLNYIYRNYNNYYFYFTFQSSKLAITEWNEFLFVLDNFGISRLTQYKLFYLKKEFRIFYDFSYFTS